MVYYHKQKNSHFASLSGSLNGEKETKSYAEWLISRVEDEYQAEYKSYLDGIAEKPKENFTERALKAIDDLFKTELESFVETRNGELGRSLDNSALKICFANLAGELIPPFPQFEKYIDQKVKDAESIELPSVILDQIDIKVERQLGKQEKPKLAISISDFVTSSLPEREDLIGAGLLPKDSTALVGGQAKLGKSLFVSQMASCLATGSTFLSKFPCKKCKVLLIQQEISEASMQKRLQKQLRDKNLEDLRENFYLKNTKGLKIDRQEGFKHLRELLSDVLPDVLILDPFYKFHTKEENKASDMRDLFDKIDTLISEFGISVIIVHHHGKPTEFKKEGAQQLRGSSVICDYGDSYFTLNRKGGQESRTHLKLSFELRNAEEPPSMMLDRDPETLWYEVTSEEKGAKVSELDILEAFKALDDGSGRVTRQELIEKVMKETGVSKRTVVARIQKMLKNKLLFGKREGRTVFYRRKEV